ncbi:PucR family transcriptional regulator [Bacillus sp. SCS-153A]|uniref:PucR family transcriptional regulator n=1 Tax=Rossellomorea sedimentorum TaxID=3115294 RepID=UPI003905782F
MKSNYYFSVEDILSRKHFEHSKVIAGHKGIHRQVKWVHVVEAPAIKNLLNGSELILTTGLALKEEQAFLSLLDQLIKCGAAAICIELETNISEIPLSVLKYAEENEFPIIVFEKEVPFVSITQDIHSILINQQYSMIKQLDRFGQELNHKLLNVNHFREVLEVLYKELGVPVLLKLKDHELEIYPRMRRKEACRLQKLYGEYKEEGHPPFAVRKVVLFEQEYAELLIYQSDFPFSEYELLLLDRTSTALAQYLMRELYFNEKKRRDESNWIRSWLKGEQAGEGLTNYLSDMDETISGGVVCICPLKKIREREHLDLTYFQLIARSIFEQQGYKVLAEKEGDNLLFILLDTRSNKTWKTRITLSFEKMLETEFFRKTPHILFAAGNYQEEIADIHKSFQTAKESLLYSNKVCSSQKFYFYDDLHLHRLISVVQDNVNLQEMIHEYLAPIMKYDEEHNGSLLHTLKIFLGCQGSKQETAKRLFIVRQTLYHRLKKIEELLGEDFMHPEKRVAIEFLLYAHDYMHPLLTSGKMTAKKGATHG